MEQFTNLIKLRQAVYDQWPSVYAAIEKGQQDQEWLEGHFI